MARSRQDPAADAGDAARVRPVNIRDVADAAGVSVATVSRALAEDTEAYSMRADTRERVLMTAQELGYRPNALARALLQHRSGVLGVIVPDISNAYYADIVRGVEDGALPSGYRVILCSTYRDPERLAGHLDTLIRARADGIVVAGSGADLQVDSRVFLQYRTKSVIIGRSSSQFTSVQVDNREAGADATRHLLDLGHRDIAFVGGPRASFTVQDRVAGYRDALRAADLDPAGRRVEWGDFSERAGYSGTARLLRSGDGRPSAVICASDRVALGAYAALHDAELRLPEQMSIVGFDDVSMASYLRPSLTTVSVPTYDLGRWASKLLTELISGDDEARPNHRMVLDTRLVRRDSSAPPG